MNKSNHPKKILSEKTHPMIGLFFEFAQLKNLYRQGWLDKGVSELDCETVADHSFGVALLGYIIAEEYRQDLDSQKVMRLGLLHDLGEIYAGDITPREDISPKDRFMKEYSAVQKVFSHLANPEKYINLWLEVEREETPEAKFVKQVDRLEMALQANLYERMNYSNLDEFFLYVQKRITSNELKSILDDVLKLRKHKA